MLNQASGALPHLYPRTLPLSVSTYWSPPGPPFLYKQTQLHRDQHRQNHALTTRVAGHHINLVAGRHINLNDNRNTAHRPSPRYMSFHTKDGRPPRRGSMQFRPARRVSHRLARRDFTASADRRKGGGCIELGKIAPTENQRTCPQPDDRADNQICNKIERVIANMT